MSKEVKCLYCGKYFDREKEPWEKPRGNRYAHKSCCENRSVEEKEEDEFYKYAHALLGESYNYSKTKSQANKYIKSGKTYKNIILALKYFYEVKENSTAEANGGIGIIPYIYDEAIEYWEEKEEIVNRKVDEDLSDFQVKKVCIKRKPIQKPVNLNFFKLD